MQKSSQPQTTNQELVQDAPAQISEEENFSKAQALWKGAIAEDRNRFPGFSEDRLLWGSAYGLAIVIQNLTSTDKFTREMGKKKVRELVKLGKEATK